ncbi:MAG: imidazole glycerol phosphate synthase subunit HisH [Bacteroidales bacterium]|nr:imidazole glycerol phosphate synthase subunit HisH [Bacteroidales bacterium]MBP6454706.1 imidazole glycerol phosphate synthase subunit HisH [Bacteroidales bacterium]MBP8676889.1 imidazole glycerol phosphate synthase subunit HisH [Bacteroidales bacterium]MBP9584931.1 imidazole glycerol phosphate synthase subunit HisH [Bacteroidales bacterium]
MTAIIDYGSGNLFSLGAALKRLGEEYIITSEESEILSANRIILPGVGEASGLIPTIIGRDIDSVIRKSNMPVLGICIGMQLLCNFSEEGETECLDYFNTRVSRLQAKSVKVPHMGWNRVNSLSGPLFKGVAEGEWFYFIHSYAPELCNETSSVTEHGVIFSSSLFSGRFFGTQFHPEKSGEAGERLLRNFINL